MPHRTSLICLAILLAGLLPFLLQVAWPFLSSFILASFLAIVMHPVHLRLVSKTRRPALSAALTTFATVFVVGSLLTFVGFTVTRELTSAYEALNRRSLEEGGWPALVTNTSTRIVDALSTRLPLNKETVRTALIDHMKSASEFLLTHVGAAIGGVTTIAIEGLFVTVFLYFLLRHGRVWMGKLAAMTPLDPRLATGLFQTVTDSVVANVTGVFAASLAQGLFLGLGFWFTGVRSPVLWGALGALAALVPVAGAPLVWIPVVIAYLLMGAYWKALALALWCSLLVGSVDNLLRPLVVGAREKQHPVLIALAAIGGTFAFGPLGILLGPLLVSVAAALVKEIQTLLPHNAPVPQQQPPGAAPAANSQ